MVVVSACLVTRGDVDLSSIIGSMPGCIDEVVVWDNSKREDLGVYGRYAAIAEAKGQLIYVQDDDCVLKPLDIEYIVTESDHMHSAFGILVCNMPAPFRHDFYRDHALVGFGACFHRDLPSTAFDRFQDSSLVWPEDMTRDHYFFRTCDIVFTALTKHVLVDLPYEDLPHAYAPERMYKQPDHVAERQKMLDLVRKIA